jgi:uracil-DNA glycosylase
VPGEPAGAGFPSPVPPGTGWPEDPAAPDTPVAAGPAAVRALSAAAGSLAELTARQSVCRACPRLVAWREEVAVTKRRSFAAEPYWGRPIPGWGADDPAILILGLAPAAHGGNRTGRVFTGDRSGDFLFASLWRCGLARQPTSVTAGDGQQLLGARMVAAVRCAPPANKPTPDERDTCAPWLTAELEQVRGSLRVIVCLGQFAWQAVWPQLGQAGLTVPRPRPAFGHGAEAWLPATPGPATGSPATGGLTTNHRATRDPAASYAASGHAGTGRPASGLLVMGCYHPSQQNTFTGRVTPEMLDAVFVRARQRAGL